MTNKEIEILEAIKKNPRITHKELSELFDISIKTVAVHIASLTKQGYLLGKTYIVQDDDYVVGIGAANIDIYGKSEITIRPSYDHPSYIHTSLGGVTRNILENLSYLDVHSKLLTAIGDDMFGHEIVHQSKKLGIDTTKILRVPHASSGVFMQVLDENNDMHLAMCDMNIIRHIDIAYLEDKEKLIQGAKAIIFDPSLNEDVIEYLITHYNEQALFVDPVSDEYAKKIAPYINGITAIKPNKRELEIMSGVTIKNQKDLQKACKKLIDQGLKSIYVSLGKDGCFYMDETQVIQKKFKEVKEMKNASGAGDSFFAGIIYGYVNNLGPSKSIEYGLASGLLNIQSPTSSNKNMTVKALEKIIKENT